MMNQCRIDSVPGSGFFIARNINVVTVKKYNVSEEL